MAEEYFYQEYPKVLYHPDGRWTEVQNKEEEQQMAGQGFVKSPMDYPEPVETAPAAPMVQSGGVRQPGYVSPSSGGGGSTPSSSAVPRPGHPAASGTPAHSAAQEEVSALETEAATRRRS